MLVSDRHTVASRDRSATFRAGRTSGSRSSSEPCTGALRRLGFGVPARRKLVPFTPFQNATLFFFFFFFTRRHPTRVAKSCAPYSERERGGKKEIELRSIYKPKCSIVPQQSLLEFRVIRGAKYTRCKVCIKCKCRSGCRDSPFKLQTAQQTGERPV